jgi:hypothetical protein
MGLSEATGYGIFTGASFCLAPTQNIHNPEEETCLG